MHCWTERPAHVGWMKHFVLSQLGIRGLVLTNDIFHHVKVAVSKVLFSLKANSQA